MHILFLRVFSSVQFSRSVVSDSLRPHELQHARPPCPSPTPGVHSDSSPSSQWCHLAISSSGIPFSSCPQSLPASESFPMSQFFTWGDQSIGGSASASVLPMNIQDWSPILHPGKGCFLGAWPGPRRHACALLLTVLRRWASSRRWLDQLPDVGKWRRRMTKTLRRSFFWCERIKEKKKEWKRHNFY